MQLLDMAIPRDDLICSARGCRAEATWALLWNNPRVHVPNRRKVWLGCDEHRSTLEDFLTMRGYFHEAITAEELLQRPDLG